MSRGYRVSSKLIDAYCHCGLSKYCPIEDVSRFMDQIGSTRAVLVQHLGEYDNSYIGNILNQNPERYAGVFLVDPNGPNPLEQLARWTEAYPFRGIRLLARTLRSHPELWHGAARLGLHIVVYEEPTIAAYCKNLHAFASEHAQTKLVISHLGCLDSRESLRFDSHQQFRSLSDSANIYVQLSGFHMFGQYPYDNQVPIIKQLVEWFGPNRLLFGTNYPVPGDEEISHKELQLIRSGQLGVPPEAVEQILCRTASDLWFSSVAANDKKEVLK